MVGVKVGVFVGVMVVGSAGKRGTYNLWPGWITVVVKQLAAMRRG